jgi:exopolyphosphatase/guanosine-5'-triphosphate,3'-diphosphate pyrophosphatase
LLSLKFAAIDIGSNAVRLLIARPLNPNSEIPTFKAVEITRLPLRLGDDVFNKGEISEKKEELLMKALLAFSYLIEIYNVDGIKACATSAMRDAKNGLDIRNRIKKKTGIEIEVISGLDESRILQKTILTTIKSKRNYLHIDVGGGSTEMTVIKNLSSVQYESFDVGTVRMMEGAIKKQERARMHDWLAKISDKYHGIRAIGTGGNIVKLNTLGNRSQKKPLTLLALKEINKTLKSMSHEQKIYDLSLNPDRAQVIDKAGDIFIDILKKGNIDKIIVPNKGLKDGMILELWQDYYQKNILKT